ncbi:MAG: gamma-butyrobetaine hydroxylase-like domain-containing protein, partial [Porticoccus sp.]
MTTHMVPTKIKLHKEDGSLSLEYSNGNHFTLTGEYLRIHSPSAEVRGHGKGQEVLQHGKKDIKITGLEPSGNYALQLTFSDGHDT